jgi:hypothetical protein
MALSAYLPCATFLMTPARSSLPMYWLVTPAASANSEVESDLKPAVSNPSGSFLSFLRGFWAIFDPQL